MAKLGINAGGYPMVILCKDVKKKTRKVHKLMVQTFYKPTESYVCRHMDGNPLNNMLWNLVPGTQKDNYSDMVKHGTVVDNRGEKCGKSKLKEHEVLEIRELDRVSCMTRKEIAELYSVSQVTIGDIVNRETWKHI